MDPRDASALLRVAHQRRLTVTVVFPNRTITGLLGAHIANFYEVNTSQGTETFHVNRKLQSIIFEG